MNTWGISGPGFLGTYAALLAATIAAVVIANWRDGRRGGPRHAALDEYELAVLNGGRELAASIALVNLDRAGAIELGDRLVRELAESNELDLDRLTPDELADLGVSMNITLLGDPPSPAHPVEVAVHRAVRKSEHRTPGDVIRASVRTVQFDRLNAGLVDGGLLRSVAGRARQARRWMFLLPVLALGLVRLAYGVSRDKPVGFLVLLLIAGGIAAFAFSRHRSERTWQGTVVLRRIRRQAPNPFETIEAADERRAPELGMALALAGTFPLWGSSPALAAAIGAPVAVEPASRWTGGGDYAGWGFGCSGGGGGSSCGGGGGGCGRGGGGGCGG